MELGLNKNRKSESTPKFHNNSKIFTINASEITPSDRNISDPFNIIGLRHKRNNSSFNRPTTFNTNDSNFKYNISFEGEPDEETFVKKNFSKVSNVSNKSTFNKERKNKS